MGREEAEFSEKIGDVIYGLELFRTTNLTRGRRIIHHRLYRIASVLNGKVGSYRVDGLFRPLFVELAFHDKYPLYPECINYVDYVQGTTRTVYAGKEGSEFFYLDYSAAQKLIEYSVQRISDRMKCIDKYTSDDFSHAIESLGEFKKTLSDSLKTEFNIEANT
jgi:hypothetical protein